MKKILVLLLALLLVAAFAACDMQEENTTDGNGSSQSESGLNPGSENESTASDYDFGSMMGGTASSTTIWSKQDEATKQSLIAAGQKQGYEVSFGADGSTTIVDTNTGESIVQKVDGTWVIKSDDGEAQLGGNWPDNEFTKLLPKPEFTLLAAGTTEYEFYAGFENVTVQQVKDYVEKVKAKGFTVDATVTDQEIEGMEIYYYTAKNADGFTVSVTYTDETSSIVIEKP